MLEILGPGIVGGLLLPILGAFPDAMLILGTTTFVAFEVLLLFDLNFASVWLVRKWREINSEICIFAASRALILALSPLFFFWINIKRRPWSQIKLREELVVFSVIGYRNSLSDLNITGRCFSRWCVSSFSKCYFVLSIRTVDRSNKGIEMKRG